MFLGVVAFNWESGRVGFGCGATHAADDELNGHANPGLAPL